jgi:hypothetical protein
LIRSLFYKEGKADPIFDDDSGKLTQLFDSISYPIQLFLQIPGHSFQMAALLFLRGRVKRLISIAEIPAIAETAATAIGSAAIGIIVPCPIGSGPHPPGSCAISPRHIFHLS